MKVETGGRQYVVVVLQVDGISKATELSFGW